VLAAQDLHVDVLVVVFVQSGYAGAVAEPEVYGVGGCVEGDAGERDGGGDVSEEGGVFGAEIVVLGLQVVGWAGVS
jgi:hypothetical protein